MFFPVSTYKNTPNSGGLPYTPPLDANNAVAAYSVRKIRTDYTGACVEVNSLNDLTGTSKDVGFDDNGYIDVSELTGSDWYVTKWYDQSGNGLHLTQSGSFWAPRISSAGVVETVNGKAAIRWDGASDFLFVPSSTTAFQFIHNGADTLILDVAQVGESSNPNDVYHLYGNNSGGTNRGFIATYDDRASSSRSNQFRLQVGTGFSYSAQQFSTDSITPNVQVLLATSTEVDNPTLLDRIIFEQNNDGDISSNTDSAAPPINSAAYNLTVGQYANSSFANYLGYHQELIIYNVVLEPTVDKSTVQANINDYFSIY